MSDTRYLILLPLKFPEGEPVPADYITETQIELARRFGGATLEPGRVSGMWMDEGLLVEDELVKLWTDVDDSSEVQLFMSQLKERLQQRFRQKVIYITAQRIQRC
jgi:hypothetical protein